MNTVLQFTGSFPVCLSINRDRKAHCWEELFIHTKANSNTAEMIRLPGSVMGLDCKYVCVRLRSICQSDENGMKTGRTFQTILTCRSSLLKSLLTMKYNSTKHFFQMTFSESKPEEEKKKEKELRRVTCAFGTCLLPVVSKWNPVLFLLIHLWADRGASCKPQIACCAREWQSSIKTIISRPVSHLLLNLWKEF